MMKVYISGTISRGGTIPEDEQIENKQKFKTLAENLRAEGIEVSSPIELPKQESWEDYMKLCIPEVCSSDCVLVIPGFLSSPGSLTEVYIAAVLKIPIFDNPKDVKLFTIMASDES